MNDLGRAHGVERQGGAEASDHVRLDYEARMLRRKRLSTVNGDSLVVDLSETLSLEHGDALVLESGARVGVIAAEEPLLAISGENLPRLAWHIGNRHTPCRIEAERLLIRSDHVLADMLKRLGAQVTPLSAAFVPEGGAYGHGRTMGHDHGDDDHHGQKHEHHHGHSHE